MEARFTIKEKFGIERLYPDNEAAHDLCKLTGMKTLERRFINTANRLGIAIYLGGEKEEYHPSKPF